MLVSAILQTIWAFLKWVTNAMYKYAKTLVKRTIRYLFCLGSPSLRTQKGFILPTTVLLLLVITLAVGAMTLRTLNRTGQVIGDRQNRVIYNAATPALERAKAKLEFMFDSQRDTRYPNGVPDQNYLKGMMLNDGTGGAIPNFTPFGFPANVDPYTFPDEDGDYETDKAEVRVDLDGDGNDDNAWKYRVDTDEDGELDATVVYSILFEIPSDGSSTDLSDPTDTAVAARAAELQVRHGPLSAPVRDDACASNTGDGSGGTSGWLRPHFGGATLYKNFQVNALVIPDRGGTAATIEFQQDRKIDEGNKWGAWFRTDLEIFPGVKFNWNGSMHTEGSMFIGRGNSSEEGLEAFLISAPTSCYYSQTDSEITVADRTTSMQDNNFEGQVVVANVWKPTWSKKDDAVIHLFQPDGNFTGNYKETITKENDSVKDGGQDPDIVEYLMDPVILTVR
jgi:hypothetical protein